MLVDLVSSEPLIGFAFYPFHDQLVLKFKIVYLCCFVILRMRNICICLEFGKGEGNSIICSFVSDH